MASVRASERPNYAISLDRAGLAIATGGVLTGVMVAGLVAFGGQYDPLPLAIAWILGSIFAMMGITAVAGPVWLVMHLTGCRRPSHAVLTGMVLAMMVFVSGQTYGFGLLQAPPTDTQTLIYRWTSSVATGLVIAIAAGFIALAMWRVAYRRIA